LLLQVASRKKSFNRIADAALVVLVAVVVAVINAARRERKKERDFISTLQEIKQYF